MNESVFPGFQVPAPYIHDWFSKETICLLSKGEPKLPLRGPREEPSKFGIS